MQWNVIVVIVFIYPCCLPCHKQIKDVALQVQICKQGCGVLDISYVWFFLQFICGVLGFIVEWLHKCGIFNIC